MHEFNNTKHKYNDLVNQLDCTKQDCIKHKESRSESESQIQLLNTTVEQLTQQLQQYKHINHTTTDINYDLPPTYQQACCNDAIHNDTTNGTNNSVNIDVIDIDNYDLINNSSDDLLDVHNYHSNKKRK